MQAGASFRNQLEDYFPLHGGEKRAAWFYRIARQTKIPAKRLEKLSYDEKCAVRAHEVIQIQQAVSGRISEIKLNAARLITQQQEIEDESIQELRGLCTQILQIIGGDTAGLDQ